MKAEIKPNVDSNRKKLADIIPLSHPFTVYIEQTRYCNSKCFYCIHSTRDIQSGKFNKLGYKIEHMDFDFYKKVIKQLSEFPKGIKKIVFSGLGEPLMNPRLPEMVKIAVDSHIADRVEIITNGILLTPETSDKLINAGITGINISVQGISADEYKNNCGVKIDFDKFVKNLSYLYNHRKNTKIYIKIIDAELKNKDEEKKFFEIFRCISDRIYIEHLIVLEQQMDNLKKIVDETKNFYNQDYNIDRKVCALCFYYLQIGCDGDIFPCANPGVPKSLSIGSMKNSTLLEIWNGSRRKEFLRTMLELKKNILPVCKDCNTFNCINNPLENLDKDAYKLVHLFE